MNESNEPDTSDLVDNERRLRNEPTHTEARLARELSDAIAEQGRLREIVSFLAGVLDRIIGSPASHARVFAARADRARGARCHGYQHNRSRSGH